jgi:hypothetical protein
MTNVSMTGSRGDLSNVSHVTEKSLLPEQTSANTESTDSSVAKDAKTRAQPEITSPKVLNCWQKIYVSFMGFGGIRAAIASFFARHISSIKPDNDFLLMNATRLVLTNFDSGKSNYAFIDQDGMEILIKDLNEIGQKCPGLLSLSLGFIRPPAEVDSTPVVERHQGDSCEEPITGNAPDKPDSVINLNLNKCKNLTSLSIDGGLIHEVNIAECRNIKTLYLIKCNYLEYLVLPDIDYANGFALCSAKGSDPLFWRCETRDGMIAAIEENEVQTYFDENGDLVMLPKQDNPDESVAIKCRIMETIKHKQDRENEEKKLQKSQS